jgi:hypothetical protein
VEAADGGLAVTTDRCGIDIVNALGVWFDDVNSATYRLLPLRYHVSPKKASKIAISCLNGVQEAASSNLATQTRKA